MRLLILALLASLLLLPVTAERPQPASPQDIFTTAPFTSCHASTVVELRNGDWMAAWFGGSGEGKPDVAIWGARHTAAAGWSAPFLLVREPDIASWNPVLFHTTDGDLWLYYKFGPVAAGWTGARLHSTDEGSSWSTPEHLPAGLLGPIRTKPLVLADGTVLSGSSMESYHAWAVWIERSQNLEHTERLGPYTLTNDQIQALRNAPLNGGNHDIGLTGPEETTGLIQPTVVQVAGAHLRFYARSSSNIGRIVIADSLDDGLTWKQPQPLKLPNPNSGIDVVHLRDGRYVLISNPVTTGRMPLTLAVSSDGLHFTSFRTLESEPGQEFSYPALIQLRDGDLLATYTWHRTRIRSVLIPLGSVPR